MSSKITSLTPVFVLAAMLAGLCASATAQTYTSFDALPNGTFPTEMDSTGRIVGHALQTGLPGQVFLRNTDGTITFPPGAPTGDWVGFSGSDNLVGRYMDASSVEHGYVGPIAGPFTSFDVSGATGTYPAKSNSSGQIVGYWTNSSNQVHGFSRSTTGTITTFDVPGSVTTQPLTINTSGQIAGLYTDSSNVLHGFIRTGTTYTKFNFPSGTVYGSAHLNDSGQVAGYYADVNFNAKGYLRDTNGTFTTLSLSGQVTVSSINQGGYIVGVFGGKYHGRKDGFMRRPDGTSATVEFPGANTINSSTKPVDINQTSVIMGNYELTTISGGDTTWHGFVVTGVH